MKILIEGQEDNVLVNKDYSNIQDRGEISHFLAELELIKLELLELWQDSGSPEEDVEEETEEEKEV